MKLSKDKKLIEHICKEMRIGFKSFTEEMLYTVDTYLQENGFQIYPEKGLRDFKNAPTNFVPTEPTYTPWQKCPVCDGLGEKQYLETTVGTAHIPSFVSSVTKPCHCCQGSGVIPMKTN